MFDSAIAIDNERRWKGDVTAVSLGDAILVHCNRVVDPNFFDVRSDDRLTFLI